MILRRLRDRFDGGRWFLLLLAALEVISCAGQPRRDFDERDQQVSSSITMYSSRGKADLERGRQLKIDGLFEEAAKVLLPLAENPAAKPEDRAAALYELGLVFSHLLNPAKDYDRSLLYLQRVVAEFPDADCAAEAQRRIEEIQKLRDEG